MFLSDAFASKYRKNSIGVVLMIVLLLYEWLCCDSLELWIT